MSSTEEQETNENKDDPFGLSSLTPPKFFKNSRNRLLDDLARARNGEGCRWHPRSFSVWGAYCRTCGNIAVCQTCVDFLKRTARQKCPGCNSRRLCRALYRPLYWADGGVAAVFFWSRWVRLGLQISLTKKNILKMIIFDEKSQLSSKFLRKF